MKKVVNEIEEVEPVGFNTKVTYRDPKTGLISRQDPYILRVTGESGSRSRYWERPAGSGNLWDKHNNPIGRWEYEEKNVRGKNVKVGKYNPEAPHIKWEAPLTTDQRIAKENAALKAELASLKAESAKKETQTKKSGA